MRVEGPAAGVSVWPLRDSEGKEGQRIVTFPNGVGSALRWGPACFFGV